MSGTATVIGCPPEVADVLTRWGVALVPPDAPAEHGPARVVVAGPDALPFGRVREGLLGRPAGCLVAWAPGAPPSHVYELLRAGAVEVVVQDWQAVAPVVLRLLEGDDAGRTPDIVGRSPALLEVLRTVECVAPTSATVLIVGETGTGKELVARALHTRSTRPGRFVAVDCGALSDGLIESELFGHVRGAYTGALHDKPGLFVHAARGTLFLDEVGSLPLAAQSSLLRALQEGKVRPVGACDEVAVDARVVAAASEPLDGAVRAGRFRADLLFRLDVIRIRVPPLRERRDDIPYLLARFAHEHARRHGRRPPELGPEFVAVVAAHDWPGNVRELRNFVERVVLTRAGRVGPQDARELLARPTPEGPRVPVPEALHVSDVPLAEWLAPHIAALERRYLEELLRRHPGPLASVAKAAGVNRRTLRGKMRELGLSRRRRRPPARRDAE